MIKVYNIMWDIDYYEDDDGETIILPTEIEIPDMHIDDIADYLSDEYGFCIQGFSI